MLWFYLILILIIVIYIFTVKSKNSFKIRGIEHGPSIPIFGDSWRLFTRRETFGGMLERTYNERGVGKRYYGISNMGLNIVTIKDPELIKQITVKDFDHFTDHLQFIKGDVDLLWSKNLFALEGKKWRDMRTTLSPAFTSSKMKLMFTLIQDASKTFVDYFEKQNQDVVEVELKDAFTRFTNDVIATTAFGIKVDSLAERNNTFYLIGKKATNFGTIGTVLKFIVQAACPPFAKWMGWGMFSLEVSAFYRKTIKETIEVREKNNIVRPDMINLLMEARKGNHIDDDDNVTDTSFASVEETLAAKPKEVKQRLTDDDITAQALLFFLGGFDSVSNLMCFTAYELAANPDIQDRVRQEVLDTVEDCNGKITYEGVMKMKYLDMVISESLRKWPSAVQTDRVCTKPYTIEPASPGEKPIKLETNECIWIPVYGLHRDANYFPNPEKFDPERFSEENKSKILPYTYLPFGAGPRNCIGSRFALLEAKLVLCELLRKFQIVPTEKSQIPLKLCVGTFTMASAGGFNFGFKKM
ncbi:unnamed protein product [Brassicogethes aeneus]|uniref:Cytochrome P450 n=1 Tax=Brassicogethes aeneus TaxID=1431903 RepID=A0A9P0BH16_BRAAE|nr:unnamed protein product [Brassicogethes aeneus]